jgi:uncharacterized membrane protein
MKEFIESLSSWMIEQGVTVATLMFGFVGAAIGVGATENYTRRQQVVAMLAGIFCAAVMPQAIAQYWGMHVYIKNALAFVSGILGLLMVMALIQLGRAMVKNPMFFFDWAFRRGPPPPPTDPSEGEKK